MDQFNAVQPNAPSSHLPAVIISAGLVGAAIDALYFSISALAAGRSPVRTLQSIAAFWLGKKSLDGGFGSAMLGAVTHVALATTMAAGFVLLASRTPMMKRSPFSTGILYGALLYAIMYLVVMPLRWPQLYPRWSGWNSVLDICVHLVMGVSFAAILLLHERHVLNRVDLELA